MLISVICSLLTTPKWELLEEEVEEGDKKTQDTKGKSQRERLRLKLVGGKKEKEKKSDLNL